ncbi:MAG: hypothetical protein JWQ70_2962 [Aeromicrobium sp.]|nr:hypothetical protein [Aeromicrobium sp.]
MQWKLIHARTRRDDRGITAIIVAVSATFLIAAVGLSVDVGNLVLQKDKVQNGVDSAAEAVAQDCAAASRTGATSTQLARCTSAAGAATAQLLLNGNVSGATADTPTSLAPANNFVQITGRKSVPLTFASAIGIGAKPVVAKATARWDYVPQGGVTFLPLAMSLCDYYRDAANQFTNPATVTRGLYRYDLYQTSTGLGILSLPTLVADTCSVPAAYGGGSLTMKKGAVWLPGLFETLPNILGLVKQDGNCSFSTNTLNVINATVTGTSLLFPSDCSTKVAQLVKGKTYLFPVYKTGQLLGLNVPLTVTIVGYAKFKVTGWRMGGGLLSSPVNDNQDSGAHAAQACTANVLIINMCRGIQGQFVTSITKEPGITYVQKSTTTLDLGVVSIKITE